MRSSFDLHNSFLENLLGKYRSNHVEAVRKCLHSDKDLSDILGANEGVKREPAMVRDMV